jgi:hypothetical protein
MKTTIQINGKDVEITLTKEQVAQINKQKQLDPKTCTLQDALDYLGEEDEEVINLRQLYKTTVSDRILSNQEAVCFNRALNEKHTFDWNDGNERKYRIWWHMDTFRFYDSCCSCVYTCVPASLCFKNENLANCAGNNKNYQEICKKFMY